MAALSIPRHSGRFRKLGVLFDSNLSFDNHISSICKTEFFYLKNISKPRPMLSMSNAEMLIHKSVYDLKVRLL